jgi:hypothetical protein
MDARREKKLRRLAELKGWELKGWAWANCAPRERRVLEEAWSVIEPDAPA